LWTTWVRLVFSSNRAVRDDLDCDSFCLRTCLINQVVYVSAAQISEGLTYAVGRGRAVVFVHRDGSLGHCDETGTRMRVPPALPPGLDGILGDVEIRVASHHRKEKPLR
jgi:hypothetical protein